MRSEDVALLVTKLAPERPGSLGAAFAAAGPRTIIFEVGGVIELNGRVCTIRIPRVGGYPTASTAELKIN